MATGKIRAKRYAIKISAPNDSNGNPRRCYVIYKPDGSLADTIDEGYGNAFRDRYPNAIELANVPTDAKTYKAWCKE